jgi:RNA polymerase sigma factor (sigma-70 family)
VTVDEADLLAERFEKHRDHLRAAAYRILGSLSEAEDAVQESWLRLSRLSHSDRGDIRNLSGWLMTAVARVCLDMLRLRKSRGEEPLDAQAAEPVMNGADEVDPEQNALLTDSVGRALLVVLDTLTPAERLAFVLHDMFAVPFDEIAPLVDRSPEAARQLASRARRRVRGTAAIPEADLTLQHKAVSAFLAAARDGDFDALIVMLDPDVVLRADDTVVQAFGPRELRGAQVVAASLAKRARGLRPALLDGVMVAAWAPKDQPLRVFSFVITDGKIAEIEIIADPTRLGELDVALLLSA